MTHHNQDPWELINSPWGEMPAWKVSSMAMGAGGALQELHNVCQLVRADSAALAARADEAEARKALIQHLCTKVDEFERRFADHEARLAAAEEQRRADQAREAEFEQEPLALPPELDDPPALEDADTHEPPGDLHSLAAKNEEPPEPLAEDQELPSELPEPPLEMEDARGVPLSYGKVPTSYAHSKDQVKFALPEPGMTNDARRKPKGGMVSQPTAISLNEQ